MLFGVAVAGVGETVPGGGVGEGWFGGSALLVAVGGMLVGVGEGVGLGVGVFA
jgi:hypothetical protein